MENEKKFVIVGRRTSGHALHFDCVSVIIAENIYSFWKDAGLSFSSVINFSNIVNSLSKSSDICPFAQPVPFH